MNSMQLLYYQAPLSALLLVMIIPFFEPLDAYHGVLYNWPFETLVRTSVSACQLDCSQLSVDQMTQENQTECSTTGPLRLW